MASLTIRALTPSDATDVFVSETVDMINQVFLEGEAGILKDGIPRTHHEEIKREILAGHLYAAFDGDKLAATVHECACPPSHNVAPAAHSLAEVSMLAVAKPYRKAGLGRLMMDHAAQTARDQGHDAMQLILWVPKEGRHEFKDFLTVWYDKLGYKEVKRGTVNEFLPHLPDICQRECIVLYMQKSL